MKKSYGKTTFVDGSTYEGEYENNLMVVGEHITQRR